MGLTVCKVVLTDPADPWVISSRRQEPKMSSRVITLRLLPQMCVGSNNAKVIRALYLSSRALSSTPAEEQTPQPYFRTQQLCPLQHDQRHLGRIFTMEEESLNVHGVGIKDRFP